MKKLILSCATAVALFAMVSCSSPASKIADIYNDATEQLKAAKDNPEKQQEIISETNEKIQEVTKDMSVDDAAELMKDENVRKAVVEYTGASMGAAMNSAFNAAGLGE